MVGSAELQPQQDAREYSTVARQTHKRDFVQYDNEEQFLTVVWLVSVSPNFVFKDYHCILETSERSPEILGEVEEGLFYICFLKMLLPYEDDFSSEPITTVPGFVS